MKRIQEPELKESVEAGGKPLTFEDFLLFPLNNDAEHGKGFEAIRRAAKIADKIEAMNGTLILEDDEWRALKASAGRVTWPPAAARKLLPYFDALEEAETCESSGGKEGGE